MPDREKVIRAWEIFRNSNPYQICDGKEFRAIKEPEYCMGQMIEDTIEALKSCEHCATITNDSLDSYIHTIKDLKQQIEEKEKETEALKAELAERKDRMRKAREYIVSALEHNRNSIDIADKMLSEPGVWISVWSREDPEVSTEAKCSVCGRVSSRPLGEYCKWCGTKMNK